MTNLTAITALTRFRRLFAYALEYGPYVSEGLERRMMMMLDETDHLDVIDEGAAERLLAMMPRIREEACEFFASALLNEVSYAIQTAGSILQFKSAFPCYLYVAIDSCIENGTQAEGYSWSVATTEDHRWSFPGLAVTHLDWRDLLVQGAVSPHVIDYLEKIGLGTRFVDQDGNPLEENSLKASSLRPAEADIEPQIAGAMMSLPEPLPGKEASHKIRAMIIAGIDPAFIFAFQTVGVLVTHENSLQMNSTILRKWDDAVVEYRAIRSQKP